MSYFFSIFGDSLLFFQDKYVAEKSENSEGGPLLMNAFEMITLSQGLNLSALFDRRQVHNLSIYVPKEVLI